MFGVGASEGYRKIEEPGYFTRTFLNDNNVHPTYLQAGQKIQQISDISVQVLEENPTFPVIVSEKKLTIKLGNRMILETHDFEDLVFTAPKAGAYTFTYSMTYEGTLLEGEKIGISPMISRTAWYLDE